MVKKVSESLNDENSSFCVLEDVLNLLRFRSSFISQSQLAAPWGISLGSSDKPRFYISLKGNFEMSTGTKNKPLTINEMDILLLPHGDKHWIADSSQSELVKDSESVNDFELGHPVFQEGEITNKILSGIVQLDDGIFHPVMDSLPAVLHFSSIKQHDPIWMTVMLLESETDKSQGDQNSVLDRLLEVLFLQLLYKFSKDGSELSGFIGNMRDNRIYKALELIHQSPQIHWTMESLSAHAGMSRATLARQFKDAIGVPPISYLNDWRMIGE